MAILQTGVLFALLAADAGAPVPGGGRTPLHDLAESDDSESLAAVARQIRNGADVNAVTSDGETPLNLATRVTTCADTPRCSCSAPDRPSCPYKGNTRMIRALLAHGADPNRADVHGMTPLFWAFYNNQTEDILVLLKAGARPSGHDGNGETTWDLLKDADPRVVRELLAHGADPNERDGRGANALHALALHWDGDWSGRARDRRFLAVARLLLARGADVRAVSDHAGTPLHAAASTGFTAFGRLLIAAGASVDAVDKHGQTPLHAAANNGHAEIAALLLDHGAAVSARDAAGLTPLHALARGRHSYPLRPEWGRVVDLLVRRGGRLDAQDNLGRTPLFHAAGDAAVARLLIVAGAGAAGVGPPGASPLHVAVFRDDRQLVKVLIAAGVKVDARDDGGRTALHWAAFMGRSYELATLITVPGIDLDAVDKAGRTALSWAVETCHTEAADLLRAHGARTPPAFAKPKSACAGAAEASLHTAAGTTNMLVARSRLAAGADVNARDALGRTPLHVARTGAIGVPLELYKLLLDKGADVSARDAMGRTPLHAAYDIDESAAVSHFAELLVCRGADPNPRDLFGWTPMDIARMHAWRAPAVPTCPSR